MLVIAIDGASRRNGKPTCVSAGGIFIQNFGTNNKLVDTEIHSCFEYGSTNQRGEMLALLSALEYIATGRVDSLIITDSEYIFNAITKGWCDRWMHNEWKTATGDPVKNADIWREIAEVHRRCADYVTIYHIKGHVMSFGKATANKLLHSDHKGAALLHAVEEKYAPKNLDDVQELSIKNNGFELDEDTLRMFVVANTMADAIATNVVEAADAARES